MVTCCTIVARNYLPHARVLAASFRQHHPDGEFFVLIIDDEQRELDAAGEPFTCLRLTDIRLSTDEIGRLAGIYDVTELATAVKPRLLAFLLAGGRDHVIYLDPDIKIYDTLQDIARLAVDHDVVLTPHTMVPVPRDGRRIDGLHILGAGVYNLGFVAVGAGATSFIEWWWGNTRREALMDHQRMMFTDQRWIDFVPSFFRHYILKDPGCNVAYWNLHGRALRWTGDRYEVDGQPLRFFHFSGFDHRRPYLLSKHQGETPRILLSEHPALKKICGEYLADLQAAGISENQQLGYGWSALPNGFVLDKRSRRLYWAALVAHERDGAAEPPNPYDPATADQFVAWLNQPSETGPRGLSRYLLSIYQDRPDLQLAFPGVPAGDVDHYSIWLRRDGVTQEAVPESLLPPVNAVARPAFTPPAELRPGVNVAGYLNAELGLGEAARLLVRTLEHAAIPHSTIVYEETASRKQQSFVQRGDGRAPFDVNVVCVSADRTPTFAERTGRGFFDGRYTAGYWFWELERLPETMYPAFAHVDEVWAATQFVTSAIASAHQRPVFTIPTPVPIPSIDPNATRDYLGLPNGFVFLFMFDFFSIIERKNPVGLVQAFSRAFEPNEGPTLVIKTINGDRRLNELEKLRSAANGRSDIRIVDEYLSESDKNSLLGSCDCYVSLHRSEGLGLTMAEAMGLRKPVIATAYSGNLDFMTPENSFLVDYTIGRVPKGSDPYPEGIPWAEPSIDEAAELMRRVVGDPSEAARRAALGQQDILTKHGVEACAPVLVRRLDEIRRLGKKAVAMPGSVAPPPPSSRMSGGLEATLAAASAMLTPTSGLPETARFRSVRLALQGVLLRLLRPYWWQQRQLQSLTLEAVRTVSETRAADTASRHAEVLQRLAELESSLGQRVTEALESQRHDTRHASPVLDTAGPLQTRTTEGERTPASLAQMASDRAEAIDRSLSMLEATRASNESLQTLYEGVAQFQVRAAEHLAELTTHLGEVATETRTLIHRLYATPAMAAPERFLTLDGEGRQVLGYRDNGPGCHDLYRGFEDVFRGDESFIRERFRVYLPILQGHAPVLDVGCGRGELLELLRDASIPARGIDTDPGMVTRCQAKGLTVTQADAIEYLSSLEDDSLGAIVAAQVIEHLPYETLMTFFRLSRARLAPGGLLIAETVNPHSLEAFKTFWTDPTHKAPIFPEVAVTFCWLHRFEQAHVIFPHGSGHLDSDRRSEGEYAVVATK